MFNVTNSYNETQQYWALHQARLGFIGFATNMQYRNIQTTLMKHKEFRYRVNFEILVDQQDSLVDAAIVSNESQSEHTSTDVEIVLMHIHWYRTDSK